MKKKLLVILIALLVVGGLIVKHMGEFKSVTVFSMDTVMTVKITGSKKNLEFVESEIERLDKIFDAYDKESELYKINASGGGEMSPDMQKIVEAAIEYNELSEGNFDITLKEVKDLWNITAENPKVPEDADVLSALEKTGVGNVKISGDEISLENGVQLDLGGIAKGYAADVIANELKNRKVKKFLIDLGGNIYAYSEGKPLKIGIQNPHGTRGDTVCTIEIQDGAVVSSGAYERNFEANGKIYHHILDPKTGYPANSGVDQVTIIAKNSALCDALSTAVAVSGVDMAKKLHNKGYEFEYIIVCENKIYASEEIGKKLFKVAEGFELIIS